jgi:hypothetical protein
MIISHRLLAMTTSLLILVGCTGAPKPVSHKVPTKQPYWEYTYLDGAGSDHSPEADRLKQAGWIFVGYTVSHGDTIIMDGNKEAELSFYRRNVPRAVMRANFKRECK